MSAVQILSVAAIWCCAGGILSLAMDIHEKRVCLHWPGRDCCRGT
jgi:hypothetical protein